jgi:hypothetical protein
MKFILELSGGQLEVIYNALEEFRVSDENVEECIEIQDLISQAYSE